MYVPVDVLLPSISACGCRNHVPVPPGKVFAQGGICRSHVIIFVFYRLLRAGVKVTAKAKASFAQLYDVVVT